MSRSASAKAALLGAALLTACSAKPIGGELAAPQPVFDAKTFFAGHTEGRATLKIIFKAAQPVHVDGKGWVEPDGTLILDQVVKRGDHAPERRRWRFREMGPNRYAGSLSDAAGPVVGDVRGNRLHLAYPMKGGYKAEQWIYLQPDGRTALNRMAITKFGIEVGRLEETIRKLD
ncbi:MAG: DUF3833 family protein [Proteobacteria bacterium]|nr:DUF3833 family protein [Pseudomonadota bacterium]